MKKQSFLQPIEGRIISEVTKNNSNYTFILELISIKNFPVIGKIKFSTFQDSLKYGDKIQTVAKIRKIQKNSNPSSFDYEEFLAVKNIYACGYSKTIIKKVGNSSSFFYQSVIYVRKFLRKRIDERFGKYSGFIKAIVIGDKSEQGSWRKNLNSAGLSHILAVSGLHIGIISLIVLTLLNIFIFNKDFAKIILIFFLLFYAAICSWSPSVTRASIMISLFLLSKLLQRKPNTNNILLLSLFFITLFNPKQLFSIGLQMSFIAVFVLLNILPKSKFIKLSKEDISMMNFGRKILNGILVLMFTSLILNIFLSPLTLYYFNQFNLNGILGNIIAIPLISIILPLAILIIFLPFFLVSIYGATFHFLMLIFEKWTLFSASAPLKFNFISVNFIQLLIFYLLLILLSFWKKLEIRIFWRYTISFILVVSFFFLIPADNGKLKLIFFDTGSIGDIFLIETPNDKIILIDTGPQNSFENNALPYLQKNGIKTLDWLIITHAHNDHYGGVKFILKNLNVKNFVVTDEFQTRKIWKTLQPLIKKEMCKLVTICDTTHFEMQDMKFKILHPDKNYEHPNFNNLSIVARLDFKNFSVLFTGDLEEDGEKYLIKKYPEFLNTDVLKIGHHGSKTSSSISFIDSVTPDYAFIPTSLNNRFRFPHKQTLERFHFLGDHLFIAGKDGALQITTDGESAYFRTYLTDLEFIDNNLK